MSDNKFSVTVRVWRQAGPGGKGRMESYKVPDVSPDMSFLEMLDVLNEDLVRRDESPIAFDSDCREGICGCCGLVVNGDVHGPDEHSTVCQLHMRRFRDGDVITVEPWRVKSFPVLKDLVADRSSLDRIMAAGGYISVNTGAAPDANAIPVDKDDAEEAMDAAACIGCGACVAACPNGSAMLFTGAKISQLALLPQGKPEKARRALAMVEAMDAEGFGNCANEYECEAVCPKDVKVANIARMNREFLLGNFLSKR
ncbi:MAG: succinate dehydrogenase iron-sulfur subunit [Elusimicrobia bacterium]|nr:MAG: succinate dehydrogenase iron-sulfur subunit [Elusimicrobiota bacterium]KAF0156982.1 MAG: succinate dehydrogenase iron-sulfur subunit [Elusimicrobiota bacterium]